MCNEFWEGNAWGRELGYNEVFPHPNLCQGTQSVPEGEGTVPSPLPSGYLIFGIRYLVTRARNQGVDIHPSLN
ncbi:MAG: hypothetical protein MAG431_01490 [Chloroflexi bacterium]|nr:hypothetical protein [Chloroflexota bacterium]